MKHVRTAAALVAAASALLVNAAPATAAPARTVLNGHISMSTVDSRLPVGAGVTVIHHCPVGSDLDKAQTRAVGEFHTDELRVTSREYWPAGVVTRYRVTKAIDPDEGAAALTAALCKSRVSAGATRFAAKAKVDMRVWGPAPRNVTMVNAALVVVTDTLESAYAFRTSMRAAGVDSHPSSVRGAINAVQETIEEKDLGLSAVASYGTTDRRVARGDFVSMRNNYRFVAHLNEKISMD